MTEEKLNQKMEASKENRTAIMAAMTEKFKEKVQHGPPVFALDLNVLGFILFISVFRIRSWKRSGKTRTRKQRFDLFNCRSGGFKWVFDKGFFSFFKCIQRFFMCVNVGNLNPLLLSPLLSGIQFRVQCLFFFCTCDFQFVDTELCQLFSNAFSDIGSSLGVKGSMLLLHYGPQFVLMC